MRKYKPGTFIISLDFELYWGLKARHSLESCRERLLGARAAIPRLLDVFARHDIAATWATVGLLFFDDKDDLLAHLPNERPRYTNAALSAYTGIDRIGRNEREDPFHFARSLIRQIKDTPRQEIASHTFSHYYCLEAGQTARTFAADLHAAKRVAETLGLTLESLVFPCNQFNPAYLAVCQEMDFKIFRGNPESWLYTAANQGRDGAARRLARLADSYLPLTGAQTARPRQAAGNITDVAASAFLRPVAGVLAPFEPLRLRRITRSMTQAARDGATYHLWWHPHNFGRDTDANFDFLGQILDHYRNLADSHGMRSASMREVAGVR